jgi:uncharacterized membrane protein YdjX (TVP38/TMEM64 family)
MSEILQTYSAIIQNYLELNIALAPVISIILRAVVVVVAPIPGTLVDLMNLTIFSRIDGFIYSQIGLTIGACANFWIARYFREPAVRRFVSLEKIDIWEKRINEKTGFWGWLFIRFATAPIYDYISYIAGLTKMSFGRYFVGTFISTLPIFAAFYYFGGLILEAQIYLMALILIPFIVVFFMFQKGKIFKSFHDYLDIKSGVEKINSFWNGK